MMTNQDYNVPRPKAKRPNCCVRFTNFLFNVIPVDQETYHYVLPVFGFALSCFSFGIFLMCVELFTIRHVPSIFTFGYMTLAGGCAAELHYAFSMKDRKQFFYWILMKVFDVLLTVTALILEIFRDWPSGYYIDHLVLAALIAVFDLFLLGFIIKKSKERRKLPRNETVYDLPASEIYSTVSVY